MHVWSKCMGQNCMEGKVSVMSCHAGPLLPLSTPTRHSGTVKVQG